MFEDVSARLEEALTELKIPVDETALVWCFRFLDRFSAKTMAAVAAFDEAELWRERGAVNMTGWLKRQAGLSGKDAGRWQRMSRRLAGLPVTAKAYEDGVLSGGQLQAILVNLNDDTAELFAEVEHELVPKIARLGVRDVSRVMQEWAAAARDHVQPDPGDEKEQPEPAPGPERSLHLSETLDGRAELSGSLDPEGRALAGTALRLAESPDTKGEPARSPARRRADALLDIFQFFLDHQTTHLGGRHRPHLNVIVNYEDLTGHRPCPLCNNITTGSTDPMDRPRSASASRDGEGAAATGSSDPADGSDGVNAARDGEGGVADPAGPRGASAAGGGGEGGAAASSSDPVEGGHHPLAGRGLDAGRDQGPSGVFTLPDPASSFGADGGDGCGEAGDVEELTFAFAAGLRGGGRLLDGTVLDATTIHRLACDAGVHRVIMQGRSSVLDYGWTTRTIAANLWAALVARDQHCRFPGCDRPPKWCEGHHVIPWENNGPTRLTNLALHCRRHHHLLHTPGWHAQLLPDGTLIVTDPKGNTYTTHPPGQLPDLFTERPPPAHQPAA